MSEQIGPRLYQTLQDISKLKKSAKEAALDSNRAVKSAEESKMYSATTRKQIEDALKNGSRLDELQMLSVDAVSGTKYRYAAERIDANQKEFHQRLQEKAALLEVDLTYEIGRGKDFETISGALAALTKRHVPYIKNGFRVELKLAAGFVMSEQVLVKGIDLSWIVITSVDPEVRIQRSSLTIPLGEYGQIPAFGSERGVLPMIGALFVMDTSGDGTNRNGVMCDNGQANILPRSGVKNASYKGVFANRSSIINAHESIFTGAGNDGAYALNGSTINAYMADFSGARDRCVRANRGSTINAHSAILRNCGGEAAILATHAATINAYDVDCSGALGHGAHAKHNCMVNMRSSFMRDVRGHGVLAESGSHIDASGMTIENTGDMGAYALNVSTVDLRDSKVHNAGTFAIHAARGSTINAHRATLTGARGEAAIMAQHASTINAWGADAAGAEREGVKALYTSNVNVKNVNFRNVKGRVLYSESLSNIEASACDMPNNGRVEVSRGGHIVIFAVDTNLNLSQNENTLTHNGIIYR